MPEPIAITKRKEADMRYAQLNRDVEETLRSKAVTNWFEAAETKPGNNAKADTAAKEMLVVASPQRVPAVATLTLSFSSPCTGP